MSKKAKPVESTSLPLSILRPLPHVIVVGATDGFVQDEHVFNACAGGCGHSVVVWGAMKRASAEKFAVCEPCYGKRGIERFREKALAKQKRALPAIQAALAAANKAAAIRKSLAPRKA